MYKKTPLKFTIKQQNLSNPSIPLTPESKPFSALNAVSFTANNPNNNTKKYPQNLQYTVPHSKQGIGAKGIMHWAWISRRICVSLILFYGPHRNKESPIFFRRYVSNSLGDGRGGGFMHSGCVWLNYILGWRGWNVRRCVL